MIYLDMKFRSEALSGNAQLSLLLPDGAESFKTLWLLHGLYGDHTSWMRNSSIERYAAQYGIAVVMPNAQNSWYADTAYGARYFSLITEELPALLKKRLKGYSKKREDNAIAGLSMGGYGALKLGLRLPERFSAIAALSPVVDLERRFNAPESASWLPELKNIFINPTEAKQRGNDLFTLAENAVKSGNPLPRIISFCGTEDFMIEDNRKFNSFMKELDFPEFYSYEYPGNHNWNFWDTHIQQALAFFFKSELPQK